MAKFRKAIVTETGQDLMARIIAGEINLKFTTVKTSDTVYSEAELESLTDIGDIKQSVNIKSFSKDGGKITLSAVFSNEGITTGYTVRNIGIYAQNPDNTDQELLYAVVSADESTVQAPFLPAYSDISVSGIDFKTVLVVGNSDNITVVVDPSGAVSSETFDATVIRIDTDIQNLRAELDSKADRSELSRVNLLDNPWFTVNRKGESSYENSIYGVDRWIIDQGLTETVRERGVELNNPTDTTLSIYQTISAIEWNRLVGKDITISIMLSDGTIVKGSGKLIAGSTVDSTCIYVENDDLTLQMVSTVVSKSYQLLRISVKPHKSVTVIATKAEIGLDSTLYMDESPNYAEEYTKCSMFDELGVFRGVTRSNENLLDNPFFTVNTQGKSVYKGAGYTVNRWHSNCGTVTVNDDNITLSQNSAEHIEFKQSFHDDLWKRILGKVVTISIKVNNKIYSRTIELPATFTPIETAEVIVGGTNSYADIIMDSHGTFFRIRLLDPILKVQAVKLEIGSESTLWMDVAPNYASELQKCLQYTVDDRIINSDTLVKTLSAGTTSITFTDSAIGGCKRFDFYTSIYGVCPNSAVVNGNSITLTFDAQSSDMEVGVKIG